MQKKKKRKINPSTTPEYQNLRNSLLYRVFIFFGRPPLASEVNAYFSDIWGPSIRVMELGETSERKNMKNCFRQKCKQKRGWKNDFELFFPCRVFDLSQSIWKTLLPSFSAMENSHLCLLQGGEIAQRRQPITMSTEARLEFGATERPFHPTTEAEGEKKQFRNLGPNV